MIVLICNLTLVLGLSSGNHSKFKFDDQGDGPANYDIIHFRQQSPGKYRWVKVGEYKSGQLGIAMDGTRSLLTFMVDFFL